MKLSIVFFSRQTACPRKMEEKWSKWKSNADFSKLIFLLLIVSRLAYSEQSSQNVITGSLIDNDLKQYVDELFSVDNVPVVPGINLKKIENNTDNIIVSRNKVSARSVDDYFQNRLDDFARTHSVSVNLGETARFLFPSGETNSSKQKLLFFK